MTASGQPGRWNGKGYFVLYTTGSRALACLENTVHRSGEGLNQNFKVMVIDIPDRIKMEEIKLRDLPKDWHLFENYYKTQVIGNDWVRKGKTAVLRVPSAIVPLEFNYLLNPNHPDFAKIKLGGNETFVFDPRIKK